MTTVFGNSRLYGLRTAENALIANWFLPEKYPPFFSGVVEPDKAILLYGPAGNGKGSFLKLLNRSIAKSRFINKWNDEDGINDAFNFANHNQPFLLLIDRLEDFCPYSEPPTDKQRMAFAINFERIRNDDIKTLVVATSNDKSLIDPKILDYFTNKIEIGLLDEYSQIQMISDFLSEYGQALDDESMNRLIRCIQGWNGNEIIDMCRHVILEVIRETERQYPETFGTEPLRTVKLENFMNYSNELFSELSECSELAYRSGTSTTATSPGQSLLED